MVLFFKHAFSFLVRKRRFLCADTDLLLLQLTQRSQRLIILRVWLVPEVGVGARSSASWHVCTDFLQQVVDVLLEVLVLVLHVGLRAPQRSFRAKLLELFLEISLNRIKQCFEKFRLIENKALLEGFRVINEALKTGFNFDHIWIDEKIDNSLFRGFGDFQPVHDGLVHSAKCEKGSTKFH